MSDAKHTPGSWDNSDESKSESVTISGGRLRLVKADGVIVAFLPQWLDKEEEAQEAKANSNLIAAAPDLLDALEGILGYFDSGNSVSVSQATIKASSDEVKSARAAIAKATGGAA